MKKIYYLFTLLLVLISCNSSSKITGVISGADNQMVYLNELVAINEYRIIDSVMMTDGSFAFDVNDSYPRPMLITFAGRKYSYRKLIVEGDDITIKGDFLALEDAEVSGGRSVELEREYYNLCGEVRREKNEISEGYRAINSPEKAEKNTPILKERTAKVEALELKIKEAFIAKYPDEIFTASIVCQKAPRSLKQAEDMLASLSPKMPDNWYLRELKQQIVNFKRIEVGKPAPEVVAYSPEGEEIKLSSLKGKVVLLDFWASWCAPCRKSNRALLPLYNTIKEQGFEILSISLDSAKDREKWIKAIDKDKIYWLHASNLQGWRCLSASDYVVSAVPTTILIDRQGKIVGRNLHGKELEKAIKALL